MQEEESITRVVRSLRGGQVTIPAEFRRALGIEGDGLLQLTLGRGELRIKPVRVSAEREGSPWLKEAYEAFAAVRAQADKYSEEEVNAAIDEAVKAVRRSHG